MPTSRRRERPDQPENRRVITDRTAQMRRERRRDGEPPCAGWIRLDGSRYTCGRRVHDGIHDAFATHGDGGVVRW